MVYGICDEASGFLVTDCGAAVMRVPVHMKLVCHLVVPSRCVAAGVHTCIFGTQAQSFRTAGRIACNVCLMTVTHHFSIVLGADVYLVMCTLTLLPWPHRFTCSGGACECKQSC